MHPEPGKSWDGGASDVLTALMRRERVDAGRLKHRSRSQPPGKSGEDANTIIPWCRRGWLRGGSDAVGEVGEYAFGSHAEGSRDQFRVEVVDQVDQPGGAQPFRPDPGWVEQVAEEVGRRWQLAGAGDLGDQDVWVDGSEGLAVVQAALPRRRTCASPRWFREIMPKPSRPPRSTGCCTTPTSSSPKVTASGSLKPPPARG